MGDIVLPIIDGDVVAYHACRPRWLKKAPVHRGIVHIELDEKGNKKQFEYTLEEDAAYLEESWKNFKADLEKICDKFWAKDYLMAVGGRNNFRYKMYPYYKNNRHKEGVKQNEFVPILRERAVEEGLALFAENREADDYIRIWAEECRNSNIEYVICTIDKDLRCIPGNYWNITKNKKGGYKYDVEKITEAQAVKNYYQQLLMGDLTDNIPGVPGLGPIKSENLLKGCNKEEEMQEIVVDEYIKAFGYDDWKGYLLSNGKMIHLQKYLNDYFSISNWPIVKEIG